MWPADAQEEAQLVHIAPLDTHNAQLLEHVRPYRHQNPTTPKHHVYDLVVLGSGAGGLVSAKQAARRGANVALIEGRLAGGDCLNVGCVPSKAILSAAHGARELRRLGQYGIAVPDGTQVDFAAVMERMRRLRAKIAPVDSYEASAAVGVDCYQNWGRFADTSTIALDDGTTLSFRKAVIATGGRPLLPSVPGLADVPYLTNETVFNLTSRPCHLAVLGAGAVGLELALAFQSLGSRVTVLVRGSRLLPREDPEASETLRTALAAAGVDFRVGVQLQSCSLNGSAGSEGCILLRDEQGGQVTCDQLLVATGRRACVEELNLQAAGIDFEADGVVVSPRLQTSNANVFAVGDCVAGTPRFTHVSGEMAKVAVENALFGGSWDFVPNVPRCIYTEPEFAAVGRAPAAIFEEHDIYSASLEHNDRAILDRDDGRGAGFVKLYCTSSGRILGATIVAARAGDMINEITLAMDNGLSVEALARVIHPYPTLGEGVMGAALGYVRRRWKVIKSS